MTSPISRAKPISAFSAPIKVAAQRAPATAAAAAAAAPLTHKSLVRTDTGSFTLDEKKSLIKILCTKLKAKSRDPRNPLTIEFDIPTFFSILRKELAPKIATALKIQDSFSFIGSGVTSCINPSIIPSDFDSSIDRTIYIHKTDFDKISNKKLFIKSHLDIIRDVIETVLLGFYNKHKPTIPLDIYQICYTYFTKLICFSDDLTEERGNRWGMVRIGNMLEIKYALNICVIDKGKVVKIYKGYKADYSTTAQDLFVDLDPFLDIVDLHLPFEYEECNFPLFSIDHKIDDVRQEIVSNRISDDVIDGNKFLAFLKKFTFTSGLIDLNFLEKVYADFLKQVPLPTIKHQLASQLKERVPEQKIGAIIALLNISFLSQRLNIENKIEIDEMLATLARETIQGSLKKELECDQEFAFYWHFCKIIFLLLGKVKVSKDIIAVKQYEKSSYQLLLPGHLLETFVSFFKKWQQFNTMKERPYTLLKLANEIFPAIRLGEFSTEQALLYFIVRKMRAFISPKEQIFLIHYLLFNHSEILEKGELRDKLLSHGPYLPPPPEDLQEALTHYSIACNLSESDPPVERIIKNIFQTREPHLSRIGVKLLTSRPSFGPDTLRSVVQLALEFPWDETLRLDEFLYKICHARIAEELVTLLKNTGEDRIKLTILGCAQSLFLECKTLSFDLLQRATAIHSISEIELNSIKKDLIFILKNVPELRESIRLLIKDQKISFPYNIIALELQFQEFNLENALVELERIDVSLHTPEEKAYYHEIYSATISKLIQKSDRTQLSKLFNLYVLSIRVLNQSIDLPLCLKFIEKVFEYKEFIFELTPFIVKEKLLTNEEVFQQYKEIIFRKLGQETMRLFVLLQREKDSPAVDRLLDLVCLQLLMKEKTEGIKKLFNEVFRFMNEESLISFFEYKLNQFLTSTNIKDAVPIIDLMIDKVPDLIKHPKISNKISLCILNIATASLVIETCHEKELPFTQDSLILYRKGISYLEFLTLKGRLEPEDERTSEFYFRIWQHLPVKEYTLKTAQQLSVVLSKISNQSEVPSFAMGCFKSEQESIVDVFIKLAGTFIDNEIVHPSSLDAYYLMAFKIYSKSKIKNPLDLYYLFFEIVRKGIYNENTHRYYWFETLDLLITTLTKARDSHPLQSDTQLQLNFKLDSVITFALTDKIMNSLLVDSDNYEHASPFMNIIKTASLVEANRSHFNETIALTNNLLCKWQSTEGTTITEQDLITAFLAICNSPRDLDFEKRASLLSLLEVFASKGIFSKITKEKFDIFNRIVVPHITELDAMVKITIRNVNLNILSPVDTRESEFEALRHLLSQMQNIIEIFSFDSKFLATLINDYPKLIFDIFELFTNAGFVDQRYLTVIFKLIDSIFNKKIKINDRTGLAIILASNILINFIDGITSSNIESYSFVLEEIIKITEIVPDKTIETKNLQIYCELQYKLISCLAVYKKIDLIPRILSRSKNIPVSQLTYIYSNALTTTFDLCDCTALNQLLVTDRIILKNDPSRPLATQCPLGITPQAMSINELTHFIANLLNIYNTVEKFLLFDTSDLTNRKLADDLFILIQEIKVNIVLFVKMYGSLNITTLKIISDKLLPVQDHVGETTDKILVEKTKDLICLFLFIISQNFTPYYHRSTFGDYEMDSIEVIIKKIPYIQGALYREMNAWIRNLPFITPPLEIAGPADTP